MSALEPSFRRAPGRRRVAEAIVIGAFLAQGMAAMLAASGTCDELASHIPSGILAWKSGRFSGGVANPPLGQLMVAALPVGLGNADYPLDDAPSLMVPARLPVLLLGLSTILVVAGFARRGGGVMAGTAALALAAFCPNLVAHSSLATLDLPATAWGGLASLLAWSFAQSPSVPRALGYALALGAAIETKATALHLVPALAAGALLLRAPWPRRFLVAGGLIAASLLGWVAVHVALARAFPAEDVHGVFFLEGLRTKWEQGRGGHFSYLFGARSATGFPHYYSVALLVKLPLPTLLLAALGAWRLARDSSLGDRRGFVGFVVLPALSILLAMSFVHRVHIGIRHVLPALPALLAIAGVGGAWLVNGPRVRRAIAGVLGAWLLFGALAQTPDPLAYFNEIAGGPSGGERILIDSNLDWGQDERAFRARVAGRDVHVNPARPIEGLVGANVNAVHGILQRSDRRLGWVACLEPVERIGETWRIVLADERTMREAGARGPREALSLARWLAATGRPDDAVATLTKNDLSRHPTLAVVWHDAFAEALLTRGEPEAAARHLVPGVDGDLTVVIAHRLSESRGAPWASRDSRERARIMGALLARGEPQEAESLARRVLAESPNDPDAMRGLLLSRLAVSADQAPVGGAILSPNDVPRGSPFDLYVTETASLGDRDRVVRAALLREAGCERRALEEIGALLAEDPANGIALELYGELVVRRKLGLSEYPFPSIDWSGVPNRRGTLRD